MATKKKVKESVKATITVNDDGSHKIEYESPKGVVLDKVIKSGIDKIKEERDKQIQKYGYTPVHDLGYQEHELLYGALTYLLAAMNNGLTDANVWPFDSEYYHYEGYESSLKKAGAFIAAELDRIGLN